MKKKTPQAVYVLMSNAGRVVAVFSKPPTKGERLVQYESYLGKALENDAADQSCWVEEWKVDGRYVCPKAHRCS